MSDTVHLILKHEYYDAIDRGGEKDVEYRENTEYWRKRIIGKESVTFHRGYTNQTMTFAISYLVVPEKDEREYYIEIHLGQRET